jgi:dihydrofolate reductase
VSGQRRLILCMSASLDGFLARPDGTLDWFLDPPSHEPRQDARRQHATVEFLAQLYLIVLGRGAAEEMARAWPGSDSPIGRLMNTLPKVVFSRTLQNVSWSNTRVSDRPVEEELPTLKAQGDRDMVCFGGARFAHALAARELIDEYRLTVHPVALGAGLPLWHGLAEPQRLRLVSSTMYADGTVTQTLLPDAPSQQDAPTS